MITFYTKQNKLEVQNTLVASIWAELLKLEVQILSIFGNKFEYKVVAYHNLPLIKNATFAEKKKKIIIIIISVHDMLKIFDDNCYKDHNKMVDRNEWTREATLQNLN